MRSIAFLALTLAACASTRGAPDAPSASPARTAAAPAATRDVNVAPKKVYEINLRFAGGAELRGRFTSTIPVEWNVHSHPAGAVVIHLNGSGTDGDIRFRAPADGTYSLMWKNDGDAPATLHVNIDADPRIVESSD